MVINDATLVTDHLAREAMNSVNRQLSEGGPEEMVEALADYEPVLAGLLREESERIIGRLALCGAPTDVINDFYFDVLRLAVSSAQAMRSGHAALWNDVEIASEEDFSVVLLDPGDRRISVIRALREATGTSLAVANEVVASCPTIVADHLSAHNAGELAASLRSAGGMAEIL